MYKASMFYVEVINTVVFRSNCIFPDFKDFSSKASIKIFLITLVEILVFKLKISNDCISGNFSDNCYLEIMKNPKVYLVL